MLLRIGECLVRSPIHSRRLSFDPSLSKIKLSSYHHRDCKIAVAWSSKKQILQVYECVGKSDSIQWMQSSPSTQSVHYKKSIFHMPRSQSRQKNSHLPSILLSVVAPLNPGDTCTILMPNTTLFLISVFCLKNTENQQREVHHIYVRNGTRHSVNRVACCLIVSK